jgi:cytochrome c-type biogenesis protein CcmE
MSLPPKNINNKKQQRIKFIVISILVSLAALVFIILNFRDNIVFFYSPSELLQNTNIKSGKIIRVGGLVKSGSIISDGGNLEFVITDFKSDLTIKYSGIKPNLFKENQGAVAKGRFVKKNFDKPNNVFVADELLSKHDEEYMPPEIKKAIDKNKLYQKNY